MTSNGASSSIARLMMIAAGTPEDDVTEDMQKMSDVEFIDEIIAWKAEAGLSRA